MPIRPENRKHYRGQTWKDVRKRVLDRAGNRCEGSPVYPDCRAKNYEAHPVTGSRVILTVAHMDHDPANNDMRNLRALCQRCHLKYDEKIHSERRRKTFEMKKGVSLPLDLAGFKEVPGFEGYRVNREGVLLDPKGNLASVKDNGNGYFAATVRVEDKQRSLYIHRAVLLAFVGPPDPGLECRHLDGNKENNNLENLEWATHAVNCSDRAKHGTNRGCANLTREQVQEIRDRARSGESYSSLSKSFGVTKAIVWTAATGKTWKDVPDPVPTKREGDQ